MIQQTCLECLEQKRDVSKCIISKNDIQHCIEKKTSDILSKNWYDMIRPRELKCFFYIFFLQSETDRNFFGQKERREGTCVYCKKQPQNWIAKRKRKRCLFVPCGQMNESSFCLSWQRKRVACMHAIWTQQWKLVLPLLRREEKEVIIEWLSIFKCLSSNVYLQMSIFKKLSSNVYLQPFNVNLSMPTFQCQHFNVSISMSRF